MTSHPILSWGPITSTYSSTSSVICGKEGFISAPRLLPGSTTELSSYQVVLGFYPAHAPSHFERMSQRYLCSLLYLATPVYKFYCISRRLWSWMSVEDQLRGKDEVYEGDNMGLFIGAPTGFLSRSVSRVYALLQYIVLTPGPHPPSQEGQL